MDGGCALNDEAVRRWLRTCDSLVSATLPGWSQAGKHSQVKPGSEGRSRNLGAREIGTPPHAPRPGDSPRDAAPEALPPKVAQNG